MFIYLFVFFIASFMVYFASKCNDRCKRSIIYAVSIIIPSILAGGRDVTVGIDVLNYVEPIWNSTLYYDSFSSFMKDNMITIEPLYLVFNYVVSRFTYDIHIFFFCHMLFILFIILLIINKLRNEIPSWAIMLYFLLYLYNDSLSMVRQSFAIVIGLLGFSFLLEKKLLYFYISVVLAYLAHSSGLCLILLHPLIYFLNKYPNKKNILYLIISVGSFIVVSFYNIIIQKMIGIGIMSIKYTNYIGQEGFTTHKIDLIFIIGIIFICFWTVKKIHRNIYFTYSIMLLILSFCITMMGGVVEVANRVAYYFILPAFITIHFVLKNNKVWQRKMILSMVFLFLCRYVYLAYTNSIVDTIPYRSKIFDI